MSYKNCVFIAVTLVSVLLYGLGCGRSAQEPVTTQKQVVKAVETKPEPEKPVETKPEPEKPVETKPEPEKPVETKPEPEKPVETKPEPEKPVETKPEPEKPVETKPEPEKPVETKPEPEMPPVKLALKFEPNDISTYKVTMEAQKSVMWEGPEPSKPSAFKGGQTSNRSEITFTQQIKTVDEEGNAVAQITIKNMKYLAKVRDEVVIDFDSTREKDKADPMHGLIGQSYSITLTPAGQVVAVTGTGNALAAIKGAAATAKTARSLIGGAVVKQRHSIPALPQPEKSTVKKGDGWSALKDFDFGMLGGKTYERIYKLDTIEDSDKGKLVVARMDAVPSVEKTDDGQAQSTGLLSKLFDNTEEYTGKLTMNLETGKVAKYREQLKSVWLAVDPESAKKPDEEPAALRMKAMRLYEIEMID
jgi:hypothetical protein